MNTNLIFIGIATSLALGLLLFITTHQASHKRADRLALFLLLASMFAGLFWFFQTCIYHDALWTYGYMRSALLDGDLSFFNEFMLFNSYFMYVPHPNDPVFYCGAALLMTPFFLMGHLLAHGLNLFFYLPANGYTWPYTLCTSLAGVCAGTTTLIMIYRLCRSNYSAFASFTGVFFTFWAGNLCFYTFVWPLYSHAFSVLIITAFLLLWFHLQPASRPHRWLIWGLLLGYATWIRPQNILFGIIPLCEWLGLSHSPSKRPLQPVYKGILFALGILIGCSPQIMLWWRTAGRPVVDAYAYIGDDFFWFRPRVLYLFFTTNRGFLTWSPVFVAAIPGFVFMRRSSLRHRAWILLLAFLLQVYLVSAYEFPEGGAGFGARYLINGMPFIALCLTALVQRLHRNGRLLFWLAFLPLLYANIGLITAYQLEIIPHNNLSITPAVLLRAALIQGPCALGRYLTSSTIHENIFARAACADSNPLSQGMLLLYVGACVIISVLTVWAFRCVFAKDRTVRLYLAILLTTLLGTDLYILHLARGPVYASVWPVLQTAYDRQEAPPATPLREIHLSTEKPSHSIPLDSPDTVDTIDITSTLVRGLSLTPDIQLARIDIIDETGHTYPLTIRNSRHCAEYSALDRYADTPFSIDITGSALHPVHHWLTRNDTGRYYYGTGYHQRYRLPKAIRPIRITIDYLAPEGTLIMNGIIFSRRRDTP